MRDRCGVPKLRSVAHNLPICRWNRITAPHRARVRFRRTPPPLLHPARSGPITELLGEGLELDESGAGALYDNEVLLLLGEPNGFLERRAGFFGQCRQAEHVGEI